MASLIVPFDIKNLTYHPYQYQNEYGSQLLMQVRTWLNSSALKILNQAKGQFVAVAKFHLILFNVKVHRSPASLLNILDY